MAPGAAVAQGWVDEATALCRRPGRASPTPVRTAAAVPSRWSVHCAEAVGLGVGGPGLTLLSWYKAWHCPVAGAELRVLGTPGLHLPHEYLCAPGNATLNSKFLKIRTAGAREAWQKKKLYILVPSSALCTCFMSKGSTCLFCPEPHK